MVGAGRFERPTPCAQDRFRPFAETACFLMLTFQADAASLLKLVERFGVWRLWAATFYLLGGEPQASWHRFVLPVGGTWRGQLAIPAVL